MAKRIYSFILKYEILPRQQFGFRPGFSTVDAILEFTDSVVGVVDGKMNIISVFLDFQKAFDTVNCELLLRKLDVLGFRGCILEWFRTYLLNRKFYVDVNGSHSSIKVSNIGVPQGSVLGPILFIIYIADMCNSSRRLAFTHFADDTTVYMKGGDVKQLCSDVSLELSSINRWLIANRLSLNIDKTYFMVISHNSIPDDTTIKMRNNKLNQVHQTKFLGIILDDKLKFTKHVEMVTNKLSQTMGMLYKMSVFVPQNVLKTLYFSLFYSHLHYGISIWGSSNVTSTNRLKSLQKRAVKLIAGNVNNPFTALNLMNFDQIYHYFSLIKFHRCLISNNHKYFHDKIISNFPNHEYSTRFTLNININFPIVHKTLTQRLFMYNAIKFWNHLPHYLKQIKCKFKFKRCLKKHLLVGTS